MAGDLHKPDECELHSERMACPEQASAAGAHMAWRVSTAGGMLSAVVHMNCILKRKLFFVLRHVRETTEWG